jgi:D-glycerate 3-kinase
LSALPQWISEVCAEEGLPGSYASCVQQTIVPLAASIVELRERQAQPVAVGVSGAQGSGKSTISLFLCNWLVREEGLSTAVVSLDDLYLGKASRMELSQTSHPLFAVRGVPGTHDVKLGMQIMRALTGATQSRIRIPVFAKSLDDRLPEAEWREVDAPVDVVLFEGWCVGVGPQPDPDLAEPINDLERRKDPDGTWRRKVNKRLAYDYRQLFAMLDALIFLRVPSFDKVLEWRRLQEAKLRVADGAGQSDAELAEFIQYYERLTRHALASLPETADIVVDIDDSHSPTRLRTGPQSRLPVR